MENDTGQAKLRKSSDGFGGSEANLCSLCLVKLSQRVGAGSDMVLLRREAMKDGPRDLRRDRYSHGSLYPWF